MSPAVATGGHDDGPDHDDARPDADAARLADHRDLWAAVNAQFTDEAAAERWAAPGLEWGLFRRPEAEVGALGDVAGLDVVELGCGTAFVSAALTRAGARVVAVDLSHHQLLTVRRLHHETGTAFAVVEADGERVPLADRCADLVVSEYGAAPWCDPVRWLAEAARLLRPGGRLAFLTNSVLAGLCVPAEGGVAGDRLLRSLPDLRRIHWPGGGTEHHPGHGEWIALLRAAGFVVDGLVELLPPADVDDPDWYEIVSADWAARWPAEDLWLAHRAG
ncbi:MAG: methyltransferase domain-containing protein [Acidimicrobiales bacterium]